MISRMNNFKWLRTPLLLLIDLLIPIQIIQGDLRGYFESVGAFGLLFLIIIGVVIHILVSIALMRIWYRFFTQEKSFGVTRATVWTMAPILLWTAFLVVALNYVPKYAAPAYDSYVKNKGINTLKQLESWYEEPTYLPPQVKFINKRVEKISGTTGKYVRILTTYVCQEINGRTFGSVSVSVSPFTLKYNLRNPQTVNISGKEAVFVGDSNLVLYENDVTREVGGSATCGVTKEDLVKIMESLQPAQFVSGTYQYYGPSYHSLD